MSSDESAPRTVVQAERQQEQHDISTQNGLSPYNRMVNRIELASTHIPEFYITPFCGAMAGVASGVVTCPLDVIKTKLQAQGGFARRRGAQGSETAQLYRGMIGTGKTIWKNQGIRGLYQGLGPMVLGYLPTWAVYLTVYDKSKAFFEQKTGELSFVLRILPMVNAFFLHRQLVAFQNIRVCYCWVMFNNSNKPYLGHQNEIDVAKWQ